MTKGPSVTTEARQDLVASVRVTPIADGAAQLHATVQFTIGAPNQPAQVTRSLLNEVRVESGGAWRVISIFPIPAPAP